MTRIQPSWTVFLLIVNIILKCSIVNFVMLTMGRTVDVIVWIYIFNPLWSQ